MICDEQQFERSDHVVIANVSDPFDEIETHLCAVDSRKILSSAIPPLCKTNECIVGIDEAGRGPVLGPMVYGLSFCLKKDENVLSTLGCADSKTLNESKRKQIFHELCLETKSVGWITEIIAPNRISNCMLRRQKYSLNEISHGSAIALIKLLRNQGVLISKIYLDTVGPEQKYQEKLSIIFPDVEIVVSKKADSLFPIVSAASICAKVIRDLAVSKWSFSESLQICQESGWGSGYPNDPQTKTFLGENVDRIFGFPRIVRFSWSTSENILLEKAAAVNWDDEVNPNDNEGKIINFFNPPVYTPSHTFFKERNLKAVHSL